MDKPILFSSGMVQAIIEGRKTQTRRVMKPQPQAVSLADYNGLLHKVKYLPGDRLWVRETWSVTKSNDFLKPSGLIPQGVWYKDGSFTCDAKGERGKLRPSIFIPRWASRLTLEVVNVRVERVQEITDADCYSEGIQGIGKGVGRLNGKYGMAKTLFAELWDNINAKRGYPWQNNPWVWVIEFKPESVSRSAQQGNAADTASEAFNGVTF